MTSKKCAYLALLAILLSPIASADLIEVEVQGTVDDCFSFSCDLIPLTTVVTGTLTWDVSGSAPSFPGPDSASGAFTWNDGTARSFSVTGAVGMYLSSFGPNLVGVAFTGPSLDFGGLLLDEFQIFFDIGTNNPFTSTDSWASLILGSSVYSLGFAGTNPGVSGFSCGTCIGSNVSGSVSVTGVPEPSTLSLLGIGLLGAGLAKRRKV
jgi:hypothetical protein